MEPLDTVHALRAARSGYAVPRTTLRHLHLAPAPFAVVAYHLAGDQGAPLALMFGSNNDSSTAGLVVVPEPRNRSLRFEALDQFSAALNEYLDSADKPQLMFANRATATWLLGLVARTTRYLPKDGDNPVPAAIPDAGNNMTMLHELGSKPGANIVFTAIEALTAHYRTGQLPSENFNLGALLGWVDPPEGITGARAAQIGELNPPAGPLSDPDWDASYLEGFVKRWRGSHASPAEGRLQIALRAELEGEVRRQLSSGWDDLWRSREILLRLDATPDSAERYEEELRLWDGHQQRMADGSARFRIHPLPVQHARTLDEFERATASFDARTALSDPLVMARAAAKGLVLDGHVAASNPAARVGRTLRPTLDIVPLLPCDLPVGETIYLTSNPSVELVIDTVSPTLVQVHVAKGANGSTTKHLLPAVGSHVIASGFREPTFYQREWGSEPWTHQFA